MERVLRYMRLSDVQDVVSIDRVAFPNPWPAYSYNYEVAESLNSFMVVLQSVPPRDQDNHHKSSLQKLIRSFTGSWINGGRILGYGGLWKIADEAHISTIATHPDERGNGYGEIVLAGMIRRALSLSASYIVLEVRVSNVVAQKLYHKYEFVIVDTKKGYYSDNGEDAYDMRLNLNEPATLGRFEERWRDLCARLPFEDYYSDTLHPRLKK